MAASYTSPEQWQCGKTLQECLGYMLDNAVSCDITFLLGKEKSKVEAHKTLLIARSPVFYAMLDGPLKEKDIIEIPDIDADTFKVILKFIYTDVVDLTAGNVMYVLYAAKKYCIESLSRKCTDFLESNLSDENACLLYEQSHIYHEKDFHDKCYKCIIQNAEKCLKDEHFRDLCPDCCDSVISSDELLVKEELIYEAMLQWSEAECQRHLIDVTDVNRRKVLGNLLYKIRFPLIDNGYFVKNIVHEDLLSDKEKLSVALIAQYKVSEVPENVFICSKRSRFSQRVIRFQNKSKTCSFGYTGVADCICFRSSNNVYLHGVVLYGDSTLSTYIVQLDIIKEKYEVVLSVETQYSADPETSCSDIVFQNPINIEKNKQYTVIAIISGPQSVRGINGTTSIPFKSGTVTFLNASLGRGTDTDHGQIPGLLLSSV